MVLVDSGKFLAQLYCSLICVRHVEKITEQLKRPFGHKFVEVENILKHLPIWLKWDVFIEESCFCMYLIGFAILRLC